MKNIDMRKLILFIAVCLTSLSYSQEIKLIDNKFTTQVMDGANQLKTISFSISQETIDKIKLSESYLKTAADSEFLKRNLEKRGLTDPLVIYLMSKVSLSVFDTKNNIKKPNTLTFVDGHVGMIYYATNGLTISFDFKAENIKGNVALAKSITNEKSTVISE